MCTDAHPTRSQPIELPPRRWYARNPWPVFLWLTGRSLETIETDSRMNAIETGRDVIIRPSAIQYRNRLTNTGLWVTTKSPLDITTSLEYLELLPINSPRVPRKPVRLSDKRIWQMIKKKHLIFSDLLKLVNFRDTVHRWFYFFKV